MDDSMRCRGMRDLLPADMDCFRKVETAFRTACQGWGYREVRTPTVEHLHLFTAAGTLSPHMLDRVYSFLDWDGWSGERVVLRPDSTIPVARLFVEKLLESKTARLFYVQSVLRFAEGDESREDWQCGVELIGDTYPLGDVELVLIACEVLQRLELTPEVTLSDPGILRAVFSRAGFGQAEQMALYDRVLDGDLSALNDVLESLPDATAAAAKLLAMEGDGSAFLRNLLSALQPAIPEVAPVIEELSTIADVLSGIGFRPRIAPVLVRDFEYYTGPVFHLYVEGRKVANGGRYDALISQVGGESVPASGFALEMEALWPFLPQSEFAADGTTRIRSAIGNGGDVTALFSLARALREAGVTVEVAGEAAQDSETEIVASSDGFSLRAGKENPRRLARVDEVVRAVADAAQD